MRKIFNLFIFICLFFSLLLFVPLNNNNSNLHFENRRNSELNTNREVEEVTTAQGFINAANAGSDIVVMNDLDFSEISTTTTIDSYSGNIDGQYHTLSNHKYKKTYDEEKITYLFNNFSGTMENITFSQFPFLINKATANETENAIEFNNITFKNTIVEDITQNYTSVDAQEMYGFFVARADNCDFRNITFSDITFKNNEIYQYKESGNKIDFGLFSGLINKCTFNEIYFLNLSLEGNKIDNSFLDNTHTTLSTNGLSNIGIIGKVADSTFEDVAINNVKVEDNYFSSFLTSFGVLTGTLDINADTDVFIKETYAGNTTITGNTFKSDTTAENSLNVSYFIGLLSNHTDVNDIELSSLVVSDNLGDSSTNSFQNADGTAYLEGSIGEIIKSNTKSDLPDLVAYDFNTVFFINSSAIGDSTDYQYETFENLDFDFWKTSVGFGSIWGTDILLDQTSSFSTLTNSDSQIYGFPIFSRSNFIEANFGESDSSTYTINIEYSPSSTAIVAELKSIFGETFTLDATKPNTYEFDTGVSTEVPIENIYDYYWFNFNITSSLERNVILGDINNVNPKTLYSESPTINNTISTTLVDSQITYYDDYSYDYAGINEYNIFLNDVTTTNIAINAYDGNQYILDPSNPTIDVPDFITLDNVNTYYQIDLPDSEHNIQYIDTNKQIIDQQVAVAPDSDLTNTTRFPSSEPSLFELRVYSNGEFNANDPTINNTISFEITSNYPETYSIDQTQGNYVGDPSTDPNIEPLFILGSTFKEFDDDYDEVNGGMGTNDGGNDYLTPVYFSAFTQNENKYEYTMILPSPLYGNEWNNYYWVEPNNDLEIYYIDTTGTSKLSSNPIRVNEEGDLTNTVAKNHYDDSQEYNAEITTSYYSQTNVLNFRVKSDNFDYDLGYDINLILYSNNGEETEINLNSENATSVSIKLDESLPYNLENSPEYTINDYYSVKLDESKTSNVSYVSFDETELHATRETSDFLAILNEPPSNKTIVYKYILISGDLTNTNEDASELIPILEDPGFEIDINFEWQWYYSLIVLAIIFIIMMVLYLLFSRDKSLKN